MSSIDLGGLSKSYLQHFVRFSTSFPQTETEINAHMLLHFLLLHEMRRTLLQTFNQGPPQSECG